MKLLISPSEVEVGSGDPASSVSAQFGGHADGLTPCALKKCTPTFVVFCKSPNPEAPLCSAALKSQIPVAANPVCVVGEQQRAEQVGLQSLLEKAGSSSTEN